MLRIATAQLGIAAEVATRDPDTTDLTVGWINAADLPAGGLWLAPGFADATARLTAHLDTLAVERDQPALASFTDADVFCPVLAKIVRLL
jgi:hypothetical protein